MLSGMPVTLEVIYKTSVWSKALMTAEAMYNIQFLQHETLEFEGKIQIIMCIFPSM